MITICNIIKYVGIIFVLSFISSCDAEHIKDYYLINNLKDSIIIEYTLGFDTNNKIELYKKSDTTLLYSDVYVFGQVGVSDDRYFDIISEVQLVTDSSKYYFNESLWIYEELGNFHAQYYLIIDSTIFHLQED